MQPLGPGKLCVEIIHVIIDSSVTRSFLSVLSGTALYSSNHKLFMRSAVEGHVGSFQCLLTMNGAVIHIRKQVLSEQKFSLLLGVQFRGSPGRLRSTF